MPIESQPGKPCPLGAGGEVVAQLAEAAEPGAGRLGGRPPGAGSPSGRRCAGGQAGKRRHGLGEPRRAKPCLLASPPRLTSRKPVDGKPRAAASRSMAVGDLRGGRSEWMAGRGRGRRGPCWTAEGRSGATRSARRSRAAARGSWRAPPGPGSRRRPGGRPGTPRRATAAGWVLLAPSRVTAAGRRPARPQASSMRPPASPGQGPPRRRRLAAQACSSSKKEDALAGVALDQGVAVADLDHHLRPHAVVAGRAVPLALLLAGPLDRPHRRRRAAGVAVEDALELRDQAARQALLEIGDPGLELPRPGAPPRASPPPSGSCSAA